MSTIKQRLSDFAKENSISYRSAYRLIENNKIPFERLPTGTILVLKEIEDISIQKDLKNKVVLYARVSSTENKNNLEKQLERLRNYANAKGYIIVKEVAEIGSGLNDNRKKLENVLNNLDNWGILIVEHKDRLARFGIHYLDLLLKKLHKKIEIINLVEENSTEDLMQDFVSIITSFTARLYGLRRSKRKTEKIIKELENERD